ncbi:nitroreductase family deazaflavin-dependent oxidoreductase [Mycolicibacterium sp. 3033]|nr:nitroreductase family deazaflavin-dependent oxidoreductase [Mycolicibacterium aurantiacum]
MRAPIAVYRAGLGFLFGSRLLMLEHIGRRTGVARYVALEVVDHPHPNVYVIASGFGEQSQWFRNVMAHREVRIWTGRRRGVPASARRMAASEADTTLCRYIAAHPRAWDAMSAVLDRSLDGRVAPPDSALPMLELRIE